MVGGSLGAIGPVIVPDGGTVACTFSLAGAPACGGGSGPGSGTLELVVGEPSGSYAAGVCADPGMPIAFSSVCSDGGSAQFAFLAGGASEEEVFGDRRLGIVAIGIEGLHVRRQAAVGQLLAHPGAGDEDRIGQFGKTFGIDARQQAEVVDVAVHLDQREQVQHPLDQVVHVAHAG